MEAPLIVITGTGTGIGKTHVAVALVRAWGEHHKIIGFKPVESGVVGGGHSDVSQLRDASSFHVKHPTPPPYLLRDPISPHLAARREGIDVRPGAILDTVATLRKTADAVVVELPGGLCSPITSSLVNAELCSALRPTRIFLIAPDRLGVLHDVIACCHAAKAYGLRLSGILLNAPDPPDPSTGTNAAELSPRVGVPVVLEIPRLRTDELLTHEDYRQWCAACFSSLG